MSLIEECLKSLEPNKVAWVNKNSISLSDVARIDGLKRISDQLCLLHIPLYSYKHLSL